MEPKINVNDLVSRLGGPTKVADLCDMDHPQGVSNWIARGRIPKPRLMYLRAIRPDAFEKVGAGRTAKKLKKAA